MEQPAPLQQLSILDKQEFKIDPDKITSIEHVRAIIEAMDLLFSYPIGKMPGKFHKLFELDLVKEERISTPTNL